MGLEGQCELDWKFSCYLGRERGGCQALCREGKIDHRTAFFPLGAPRALPKISSAKLLPDLYKNLHVRPVESDGHSAHSHLPLAVTLLLL